MQNKFKYLFILFITTLLFSCSENETEDLKPEKVEFSFTVASSQPGGGRVASADLPAGTSLLLSINNSAGVPVLTHHRINLLHIGDDYITEPLELAPGRYAIKDFMLVNASSDVLYATPQRNAPLAKIVTHALPFSFVVGRNQVANIEMEVVDAQLNQPEDFGYTSFNVQVVNPLRISVFKNLDGNFVLTDAKAYLYQNDVEQTIYNLSATINLLSFKGDPLATYTLVIKKDGYKDVTRVFTYNNLITELDGKPLKVILDEQPVFTFADGNHITIIGFNASGTITIDWSNGEIQTRGLEYDPNPEDPAYANWTVLFPESGELAGSPVKVTGDLHIITSFMQDHASNFDARALTSLKALTLSNGYIDTLNLTYNTTLESLTLEEIVIDDFKFPVEHNIKDLWLAGDVTYIQDMVIDNIYNNAVAKSITGGSVGFYGVTDPISTESQNKIDILRDSYGWTIFE